MHLICRNMHLICINMQQICTKYAKNMQKICHYIDFNIANMQFICKKYAKNMLDMQQKYAKNMQKKRKNMHKSVYLHILHIYALPTLLMRVTITPAVVEIGGLKSDLRTTSTAPKSL